MSTQKIKFILAAEIVADASNGLLLGEFNNWEKESGFSLKKGKDGSMQATVSLEAGRSYQYRYLLDGGRWVNDHNADGYAQIEGFDIVNCVIHVPAEVVAVRKPAAKKAVQGTKQKPEGKKIATPVAEKKAPVAEKTPAAEKAAPAKKSVATAKPVVEEKKLPSGKSAVAKDAKKAVAPKKKPAAKK